jgi:hypothetical protein
VLAPGDRRVVLADVRHHRVVAVVLGRGQIRTRGRRARRVVVARVLQHHRMADLVQDQPAGVREVDGVVEDGAGVEALVQDLPGRIHGVVEAPPRLGDAGRIHPPEGDVRIGPRGHFDEAHVDDRLVLAQAPADGLLLIGRPAAPAGVGAEELGGLLEFEGVGDRQRRRARQVPDVQESRYGGLERVERVSRGGHVKTYRAAAVGRGRHLLPAVFSQKSAWRTPNSCAGPAHGEVPAAASAPGGRRGPGRGAG